MRYPHIATRVFDTPLLIAQAKLDAVLSVLGPKLGFEVEGAKILFDDDDDGLEQETCLYSVQDGVACIPIHGTLVHRSSWLDAMSGLVSYQQISEALAAALADRAVTAIVLDIDSSGGEVSGCFDCGDEIFAARGVKPIIAVANEFAMSGAYLLASAADELIVAQTALTGSVGVVWTHVDRSEARKLMGLAVTHLYAGKHKVDGTPEKPLTGQAKASIQGDIDQIYELFVSAVSRNRGLDADAVRATEAEIYRGESGVEIGFADRVGTLKETLQQLAETSRPPAVTTGTYSAGSAHAQRSPMTNKPSAAGGDPAATTSTINAADVDKAKAEGRAEGVKAERERIRAITASPEAEGRTELAQHLAYDTEMTADQAKGILAKSAKAEAAKPSNALETAMAGVKNPQVGADAPKDGKEGEEAEAAALAGKIVALHTGKQPKATAA